MTTRTILRQLSRLIAVLNELLLGPKPIPVRVRKER